MTKEKVYEIFFNTVREVIDEYAFEESKEAAYAIDCAQNFAQKIIDEIDKKEKTNEPLEN